jgi:hypothetical protein
MIKNPRHHSVPSNLHAPQQRTVANLGVASRGERHPFRDMGQRPVRLPDHQHRDAAEVMTPDDADPFAATWMKRIVNRRILALVMGSMLPSRPAAASRTWRLPSAMPWSRMAGGFCSPGPLTWWVLSTFGASCATDKRLPTISCIRRRRPGPAARPRAARGLPADGRARWSG